MISFTKMHGTGNDYIYINAIKDEIKNPGKLAVQMCNRNTGIGANGLILILKSNKAAFAMRIFNADGSEAEMCGNGIRCFAKYLYDHKLITEKKVDIETKAGVRNLYLTLKKEKVHSVLVDMGEPILQRDRIPMLGDPGMVIDETMP